MHIDISGLNEWRRELPEAVIIQIRIRWGGVPRHSRACNQNTAKHFSTPYRAGSEHFLNSFFSLINYILVVFLCINHSVLACIILGIGWIGMGFQCFHVIDECLCFIHFGRNNIEDLRWVLTDSDSHALTLMMLLTLYCSLYWISLIRDYGITILCLVLGHNNVLPRYFIPNDLTNKK